MRSFIADFVRRHGWPAHVVDRPLCIGHRGACAHANENTMAAFRVAATLGADMWELDVRLSRDGVVVVSHNETVAGANGRQIALAAHDAADIAGIMLDRGGIMPSLQAVIDLATTAERGLYVEVKERAAALPALRLLSESAVPFAAIGSFDHDTVRDLAAERRVHPRFPVSVLVRVGEDPFIAAAATGADIIHLCWERASDAPDRLVTPDLLARAAGERLAVLIWHEERCAVLDRLVKLAVVGICTDKPELMNRYVPHPDYPIAVVCHRCMNRIAPENTLHAARLCYEQGFQVVELDVRRTADGGLAVVHDATLDRTTDGTGPVAARTIAELSRLSAGIRFDPFFREEHIVPLAAFLETAGAEGQLYIEIKDADPSLVLAEVELARMLSRVFFWSPDAKLLSRLRRLSGDARIMVERAAFATPDDAIQALHPAVVQWDWERDDAGEIATWRRAGVAAMVKYFGSERRDFVNIINLKPDLINLDRPDVFLAAYAAVTGAGGQQSTPYQHE